MYRDVIEVNQLSFQGGASPLVEALVFFNDKLMCVFLVVFVLVSWIILLAIFNTFYCKYLIDGSAINGGVIKALWYLPCNYCMRGLK